MYGRPSFFYDNDKKSCFIRRSRWMTALLYYQAVPVLYYILPDRALHYLFVYNGDRMAPGT